MGGCSTIRISPIFHASNNIFSNTLYIYYLILSCLDNIKCLYVNIFIKLRKIVYFIRRLWSTNSFSSLIIEIIYIDFFFANFNHGWFDFLNIWIPIHLSDCRLFSCNYIETYYLRIYRLRNRVKNEETFPLKGYDLLINRSIYLLYFLRCKFIRVSLHPPLLIDIIFFLII